LFSKELFDRKLLKNEFYHEIIMYNYFKKNDNTNVSNNNTNVSNNNTNVSNANVSNNNANSSKKMKMILF
jgi:hypothetical protein